MLEPLAIFLSIIFTCAMVGFVGIWKLAVRRKERREQMEWENLYDDYRYDYYESDYESGYEETVEPLVIKEWGV